MRQTSRVAGGFAALMLSAGLLSGCTGAGAFPAASPSASASNRATAQPRTDAGRVAQVYEQFLNGLYSLDATQQQELTQLAQQYPNQAAFTKLSAAKQANVVATVKKIDPALSLLDVSKLTPAQQFLIYSTLLYLGGTGSPTSSSDSAPRVSVDEAQVKVNGSKATVPLSALSFTIAKDTPAPYPTDAPIVAQNMPFEKVGGSWLIDGSAISPQAAN